jgi:hypothetical protein
MGGRLYRGVQCVSGGVINDDQVDASSQGAKRLLTVKAKPARASRTEPAGPFLVTTIRWALQVFRLRSCPNIQEHTGNRELHNEFLTGIESVVHHSGGCGPVLNH